MIKLDKKFAILYVLIMTALFAVYEVFSPVAYPILLLLTGNGRFNDWWLSLDSVSNYPNVADTICTIPWVYAYILSAMHSNFGNFLSYVIYTIFSILIFSISYKKLNLYYDKIYSFLFIFSYPVMFGFWRGNSDFLIYGLILASYFYAKNSQQSISLLYLGSAIAFKPYQFFLLFSYSLRDLRNNILILCFGTLLIIILILIANNNFFNDSYIEIIKCGKWYIKDYVIGDGGTLHNNSVWGLFKLVIYYFYKSKNTQSEIIEKFSIYIDWYPAILILFFAIFQSFIKLFEDDKNNFSSKFFMICLLIPLLSPIVPDYRLFFINLCLIISLTSKFSKHISSSFIISILIFILIPKEFLWFSRGGAWFTPNGALNCVAMMVLLIYLVLVNFNILYKTHIHKPSWKFK